MSLNGQGPHISGQICFDCFGQIHSLLFWFCNLGLIFASKIVWICTWVLHSLSIIMGPFDRSLQSCSNLSIVLFCFGEQNLKVQIEITSFFSSILWWKENSNHPQWYLVKFGYRPHVKLELFFLGNLHARAYRKNWAIFYFNFKIWWIGANFPQKSLECVEIMFLRLFFLMIKFSSKIKEKKTWFNLYIVKSTWLTTLVFLFLC